VSSLADVLPADHALIVPWDPDASADRLLPVIGDPAAHLTAVREAGERYTWDRTAAELRGVYEEAVRLPGRVAAIAAEDALQAELARAGWEDRFWDLRRDIGPTGLSLVGPEAEGRLLPEDAQRTLAALARRRVTRAPLLAALQAAQRVKRS
jgi:hypothetical protein